MSINAISYIVKMHGSEEEHKVQLLPTISASEIMNYMVHKQTFSKVDDLNKNKYVLAVLRKGEYKLLLGQATLEHYIRYLPHQLSLFPSTQIVKLHYPDKRSTTKIISTTSPIFDLIQTICKENNLSDVHGYALYSSEKTYIPLGGQSCILEAGFGCTDLWFQRRFWVKAIGELTNESDLHFTFSQAQSIVYSNYDYDISEEKLQRLCALNLLIQYQTKAKIKELFLAPKRVYVGYYPPVLNVVKKVTKPAILKFVNEYDLEVEKIKSQVKSGENSDLKVMVFLKSLFIELAVSNSFFGITPFEVELTKEYMGKLNVKEKLSQNQKSLPCILIMNETCLILYKKSDKMFNQSKIFNIKHCHIRAYKASTSTSLFVAFVLCKNGSNTKDGYSYFEIIFETKYAREICDHIVSFSNYIKIVEKESQRKGKDLKYRKIASIRTTSSMNMSSDFNAGSRNEILKPEVPEIVVLDDEVLNPAHPTYSTQNKKKRKHSKKAKARHSSFELSPDEAISGYQPLPDFNLMKPVDFGQNINLNLDLNTENSENLILAAEKLFENVIENPTTQTFQKVEYLLDDLNLGGSPIKNLIREEITNSPLLGAMEITASTIDIAIRGLFDSDRVKFSDVFNLLFSSKQVLVKQIQNKLSKFDFVKNCENPECARLIENIVQFEKHQQIPLASVLVDFIDPEAQKDLKKTLNTICIADQLSCLEIARILLQEGIGIDELTPIILNQKGQHMTNDPILAKNITKILKTLLVKTGSNDQEIQTISEIFNKNGIDYNSVLKQVSQLEAYAEVLSRPAIFYLAANSENFLVKPKMPRNISESLELFERSRKFATLLNTIKKPGFKEIAQQLSTSSAELHQLFVEINEESLNKLNNSPDKQADQMELLNTIIRERKAELTDRFVSFIRAWKDSTDLMRQIQSLEDSFNLGESSQQLLLNLSKIATPQDLDLFLALDSTSDLQKREFIKESYVSLDSALRKIQVQADIKGKKEFLIQKYQTLTFISSHYIDTKAKEKIAQAGQLLHKLISAPDTEIPPTVKEIRNLLRPLGCLGTDGVQYNKKMLRGVTQYNVALKIEPPNLDEVNKTLKQFIETINSFDPYQEEEEGGEF